MAKKGPDVDAVVTNPVQAQAVALIAAWAEASGATNIRARLDGYSSPEVIPGVLEPHRPDLVFTQSNILKTAMIVDAVMDPKELNHNRVLLFKSACQRFSANLGFVISKDVVDGESSLRYRLNSMGIVPQKVWVI
jgi:hypothetical protein